MSLPAAVLDTILARLALLFLAGAKGNETVARHAAAQMLAAYDAETEDEVHLAANIITFSFHALEALGQAATPDMPMTKILRLRGSAVSLSRESHKAQRRLDQLKKARRNGSLAQPQLTTQPTQAAEKALELVADTRKVAAVAQQTKQTWTQAYRQRQRDKHLAKQAAKQQSQLLAHTDVLDSNPAATLASSNFRGF